ncbi:hypothetical protein ACFL5M_03075 [Candidatus Neomarinimicrobiota bacterium]
MSVIKATISILILSQLINAQTEIRLKPAEAIDCAYIQNMKSGPGNTIWNEEEPWNRENYHYRITLAYTHDANYPYIEKVEEGLDIFPMRVVWTKEVPRDELAKAVGVVDKFDDPAVRAKDPAAKFRYVHPTTDDINWISTTEFTFRMRGVLAKATIKSDDIIEVIRLDD